MPVITNCPSCSAKFRFDEKLLGKKVRCPKCAATILIPTDDAAAALAADLNPPGEAPKVAPAKAKPLGKPASIAKPMAKGERPVPTAPAVKTTPTTGFPDIGPIVVATSNPPKPAATTPASNKAPISLAFIIAGAAAACLLILGGLGYYLASGSKPAQAKNTASETKAGKKDVPASVAKGTIVVNWPAKDRIGGQITLNGVKQNLPAEGELALTVEPGKHRLALRRRNYEIIQESLEVAANERKEFAAEWKELPVPGIASTNPTRTNPVPPPVDLSQIGKLGGGVVVRGFEGWVQSVPAATALATQENKGIVIVFGSSDGSVKTAKLAAAMKTAGIVDGELAKSYVPVIIDLPQTGAGRNKVLDYRGNVQLANDYGIDDLEEVPVLVLADAQGRPYAVERQWTDGTSDPTTVIARLNADKEERDTLWAATKADANSLAAAAKLGDWIIRRKLLWHYRDDFKRWYQLAVKGDPQNAAGQLEVLLEGEFLIRLRQLNPGDVVELTNALALLDPFLKPQQFQDADRGARLHFIVGRIYMQVEEHAEGLRHFEKAVSYPTKDATLKKQLEQVKFQLANKNVLGNGTGFVIADGGYLLTNRHVVEGPGKIMVRMAGVPEPIPATTIHISEDLDVALLKVEIPNGITAGPLAFTSQPAELSMEAAAYGFPSASSLGDALKATTGTVAALPTANTDKMLLLDLKVNPGNSGGPLIDKMGHVVGVVTAKTGTYALQDSYGLAIPATDVKSFLKEHLPEEASLPKPTRSDEFKNWAEVTKQVQSSVVMILKVR